MKKVLIGCAIAVGVVLVSGIIGSVVVVNKFKEAMPDLDAAKEMEAQLLERDGALEDTVMPLDGSIDPQTMEKYLVYRREMVRRTESDVRELVEHVGSMGAEQEGRFSGLRKIGNLISGGVGLAKITVGVSVTADSLLWEGELRRADLVYLTGLSRFGAMDWQVPLGDELGRDESAPANQEEVDDTIESLHEEFEKVFRQLLRNQYKELERMPERGEAEESWFAVLVEVLADRSTFDNLSGKLLPSQLEVLGPHMTEIAELAPKTQTGYFLELIPMVDDEEDHSGINITIDE